MTRDWQEWHEDYDDPTSSLSRRLADVRRLLGADLDARADAGQRALRLLSLCAGDGRDTIPVLAARPDLEVDTCLVELDPVLADAARTSAIALGLTVDVRAADAGTLTSYPDRLHNDVLLLCGIFGNVSDAAVERCVRAAAALLRPGGTVIWTRGSRETDDPAERVRRLFADAGFEEVAFVAPADATYRIGVARCAGESHGRLSQRLFTFVR